MSFKFVRGVSRETYISFNSLKNLSAVFTGLYFLYYVSLGKGRRFLLRNDKTVLKLKKTYQILIF
jgi:hypothetical protein